MGCDYNATSAWQIPLGFPSGYPREVVTAKVGSRQIETDNRSGWEHRIAGSVSHHFLLTFRSLSFVLLFLSAPLWSWRLMTVHLPLVSRDSRIYGLSSQSNPPEEFLVRRFASALVFVPAPPCKFFCVFCVQDLHIWVGADTRCCHGFTGIP